MGQPTPSDVHIDAALTDVAIAYIQDQTNFIASQAMPTKPVQHQTNKFFKFVKDDWNRDDAVKKRAPGEAAPRSGMTLSNDSYSADAWWTEVPLSDMVRSNADPSLPLDQAASRLVTQRMLIRKDRLFVTKFLATGIWGTDVVGATDFTKWDDYASDPQKDIDTGKNVILKNTGFEPNKLTVAYNVHQALKRHPLIKDQIKYTTSESITEAIIAKFFEVDRYIVAKSVYSSSNEGAASKTMAFTVGPHALLSYDDGTPSIMAPCAAAIFTWTGLTGINAEGVAIDQYYDVKTKEDVVRGQFAFDMKVIGTDLGYFFSAATA